MNTKQEDNYTRSTVLLSVASLILFLAGVLFLGFAFNAEASEILYSESVASTTIGSNITTYGARWSSSSGAPEDWLITRVDFWIGNTTNSSQAAMTISNSGASTSTVTASQAVVANSWNTFYFDEPISLLDYYTAGGGTVHLRMSRTSGTGQWTVYHTNQNLDPIRYSYTSGDNVQDPLMRIYGFDQASTATLTGPAEIRINEPLNGDETASRTFDVDIDYLLASTVQDEEEYEFIQLALCSQAYPDDECEKSSFAVPIRDVTTNVTRSLTAERDGYYLLLAYFWNGVSQDVECSWSDPFCDEMLVKTLATESVRFNVATTTITPDFPLSKESALTACDDSYFFGADAICKVLVHLFMPSETAFTKWNNIDSLLATKMPFGFYMQIRDDLSSIASSSGETYSNIEVDLSGTVFEGVSGGGGMVTLIDFDELKSSTFFQNQVFGKMTPYVNVFLYIFFFIYIWRRINPNPSKDAI